MTPTAEELYVRAHNTLNELCRITATTDLANGTPMEIETWKVIHGYMTAWIKARMTEGRE